MDNCRFYIAGSTPALDYAVRHLQASGCEIVSRPDGSVTHLLLPVPSFDPDGTIKGGLDLADLLHRLPKQVTVIGGNLSRPELERYSCIDFLRDPLDTAQTANITAHCAIKAAMNAFPGILEAQPVLVIGWGRIGKCLAQLLRQLGARVTVAARKASDRAILSALGFRAVAVENLDLLPYRIIFNTVPQMICPDCPGDALKIDLASHLGLGSPDVIWARGLPGKDAPESSGTLIAQTVLRHINGKE